MKQDRPNGVSAGMVRLGYLVAGFVLLALGIIGAFLPLMPTTIFVILAAGCFARSNRRIDAAIAGIGDAEPPTVSAPKTKEWEREYLPNMSGTADAMRPPGSLARSGKRPRATGDYEAWKPE